MNTEYAGAVRTSAAFKVQINGQHLRLRIDESALAELLAGRTLRDSTRLGAGRAFTRSLVLGAAEPARLDLDGDQWRIELPRAAVVDYVSRLPCREGLAFALAIAPDLTLHIDFEVDVRDSRRVGRTKAAGKVE